MTYVYPGAFPKGCTKFHVSGVVDDGDACVRVEDREAEFFSVYAECGDGLQHCVADLSDRESADDLKELLEYALAEPTK
jgi:hypothetical protein